MILSFDAQLHEIANAIGVEGFDAKVGLKIAETLFTVYDKGIADERDHCVRIVQRMAISPQPIVAEMRKSRR